MKKIFELKKGFFKKLIIYKWKKFRENKKIVENKKNVVNKFKLRNSAWVELELKIRPQVDKRNKEKIANNLSTKIDAAILFLDALNDFDK